MLFCTANQVRTPLEFEAELLFALPLLFTLAKLAAERAIRHCPVGVVVFYFAQKYIAARFLRRVALPVRYDPAAT